MLDHGDKWTVTPDWQSAVIEIPGLRIRSISIRSQFFVSGELDAFRNRYGLADAVGALGQAFGETYCTRLASDRLLAVGLERERVREGWNDEGYAVTSMTSGLRVFEISGAEAHSMVSRACVLDPADPGPSSSVLFAGAGACLYRHGDAIRLHVDRGLAAYVWGWMASRSSFVGVS